MQRHQHRLSGQLALVLRRRVGAQFLQQRLQALVCREVDVAPQSREQVRTPLPEVEDARRQPPWVQAEAQHVEWRRQQLRVDADQQGRHRCVGRQQVPLAVHRQGRVRLVGLEQLLDGLARGVQCRIGQVALGEQRRIAGRRQQTVAFAQGDFQLLGKMQQHLAAGMGAAGLDEAQVARGNLRVAGQVELAEAASLAPLAQQDTYGMGMCIHGTDDRSARECRPLPDR
ncbi:hypothetical protein D9M68_418680 [compost metagenome]